MVRGPSSQGLLPSQGQQDLSARGGHRGRDQGRSLVSLAGLDEGHPRLEADLHHGLVGRASALRPLLAASLLSAPICTTALQAREVWCPSTSFVLDLASRISHFLMLL